MVSQIRERLTFVVVAFVGVCMKERSTRVNLGFSWFYYYALVVTCYFFIFTLFTIYHLLFTGYCYY